MNNTKLAGLLGLASRAREVFIGDKAYDLISNDAKVLLISNDASERSKNQLINRAKYYNVEYFIVDDYLVNSTIGKVNSKYLVVIDEGFSKGILDICRER